MKYLSDVEAKIELLRDIKKELFWLRMNIAICTGFICGSLYIIALRIH